MAIKQLQPTFSRYERVNKVVHSDPALEARLSPETVSVMRPGNGLPVAFSPEVVETTKALYARGVDIHKASSNEIIREAVKHLDLKKATEAKIQAKPKPKAKAKPVAKAQATKPVAKAQAKAAPKVPVLKSSASKPPEKKSAKSGDELMDKANVYVAAYSNIAHAHATLERWDREPGAKERLAKVRELALELRELGHRSVTK